MSVSAVEPFLPDANTGSSTGTQPPAGRARPWKVIAQQVSHEQDSAKLTKLVAELNQALDEQGIGMSPAVLNPDDQVDEKENGSGSLEKH
jgi:hypothetical protein